MKSSESSQSPERLLTTSEAARLLQVAPEFLRRDRRRDHPSIPVVRLGTRLYRYRAQDVQEALDRLTHGASTGEAR